MFYYLIIKQGHFAWFDVPFVSHLLLTIVSCDKVAIRIDIERQAKRLLEI